MPTEDEREGLHERNNDASASRELREREPTEQSRWAERQPEKSPRSLIERTSSSHSPPLWQSKGDELSPSERHELRERFVAQILAETFGRPSFEAQFGVSFWAELNEDNKLKLARQAEDRVAALEGRKTATIKPAYLGGAEAGYDHVTNIIYLDVDECLGYGVNRPDFLLHLAHEMVHAADNHEIETKGSSRVMTDSELELITYNKSHYFEWGEEEWEEERYRNQPIEYRAFKFGESRRDDAIRIIHDNKW